MFKLTITLTDKDIEAKELVLSVNTKGQAKAVNSGTANTVKAEVTKAVEL